MTLERAAGLVGYLARLGVSHLYASPLFTAAPGSTHGYDVTDFGAIEPAIGGERDFDRLSAALDAAGIGLLLDFVPNHMATADENHWWQAVLEWGADSPYAKYFDIDWQEPKLVLPILGTPYIEALQNGVLGIAFDATEGEFEFICYDRRLSMTPTSYGLLLALVKDDAVAALAPRFAHVSMAAAEGLKRELARHAADGSRAARIEAAVKEACANHTILNDIHEAQPWRLAHWPVGRDSLTYRSFFEIDELICLRVEDPDVFEAVHAKLFALVEAAKVAGVRLDHIDGLADPKNYLDRFQRNFAASPFYLLVEKILEPGESFPTDWPVAGTTGYEFIAALAGLFVDPRQESAMDAAYEDFTGPHPNYDEAVRDAKREIIENNLAADLRVLAARAHAIASEDIRFRDFGSDTLRRAIIEIIAALPVYRTYVTVDGAHAADRAVIARAAAEAAGSRSVENPAAVDFVAGLLLFEIKQWKQRDAALEFVTRFQQTTGPVMAKALEDTVFYRENRLIALNEVGGSGDGFGAPRASFHATMAERLRTQPTGLSATATHDTKRGEDARARLYVLSEAPDLWREATMRWNAMNAPHRVSPEGEFLPEPATEWLFYQALAGVWPLSLRPDAAGQFGDTDLAGLQARMLGYMEKAIREAKCRTSWINQDSDYEAAVARFVRAALSMETGTAFLQDFARTCRPIWIAGAINGLTQLAIKLAAPGVPDFYQGSELWDFSLVDPDNRTPVDFAARQEMLDRIDGAAPADLLDDWESGAPKMALTAAGLRLRAGDPALFSDGAYLPLDVIGEHARRIVAFARVLGDRAVMLIAPRFTLSMEENLNRPLVPADRWGDTAIIPGQDLQGRRMLDVVTGDAHDIDTRFTVATTLSRFPVALLASA